MTSINNHDDMVVAVSGFPVQTVQKGERGRHLFGGATITSEDNYWVDNEKLR
jgi:hypothetical protein